MKMTFRLLDITDEMTIMPYTKPYYILIMQKDDTKIVKRLHLFLSQNDKRLQKEYLSFSDISIWHKI